MSRIFLLVLMYFVSIPHCFTQSGHFPGGTRSSALANASITLEDPFSIVNNQAGLAGISKFTVALSVENKFIKSDVGSFATVFALPTKSGNFGVGLQYFGFHSYNEHKASLAYARKITQKLSLGAAVDYIGIHISGYGDKSMFTFETGLRYELLKELAIGVHLFNPLKLRIHRIEIGKETVLEEFLPTIIRAGLGYRPSSALLITAEVIMDDGFQPGYALGIEYRTASVLTLRAGISNRSFSASFGLGLSVKKFIIDLSSTFHPVLGYGPGLGITYQFNQENESKK